MIENPTINRINFFRTTKLTFSLIFILVGGLIYLGYRPTSLIMFQWANNLNLNHLINSLRSSASLMPLSNCIIYNLPGALWLLSYLLLIDGIWGNEKKLEYKLFLYSVPFFALLFEYLQLVGILNGTFDIYDIIYYLCVIAIFKIFKYLSR